MAINGFLCGAAAAVAVAVAAPASAQEWNGAYYGAKLGFGNGSYQLGVDARDEVGPDVSVGGLIYGAQAGVNFRSGSLVYGFDAGLTSGPTGLTDQGTLAENFSCGTGDCYLDINAIGTLRGRVGFVTDIRTMVYGAAGLAVASVEGGVENSDQEGSSSASGVTYALGVERVTSPFSSIFAEVGVYDLGALKLGSFEYPETSPPAGVEDFTGVGDFIAISVGLNYEF